MGVETEKLAHPLHPAGEGVVDVAGEEGVQVLESALVVDVVLQHLLRQVLLLVLHEELVRHVRLLLVLHQEQLAQQQARLLHVLVLLHDLVQAAHQVGLLGVPLVVAVRLAVDTCVGRELLGILQKTPA